METLLIILLLAILTLILIYTFYGRRLKEKKGQEPQAYIDGLKALLEGRDEVAFGKFREVVSEDSSNIDAYIRIGNILRRYNKIDKALQVHKDLTLRHGLDNSQKLAILEAVADDFIKLDDYNSAKAALVEAIRLDGNDAQLSRKLIKVFSKLGEWDGAFAARQKLAKFAPDENSKRDLSIYKFLQGRKQFDKKKYRDSRITFKEAIHIDEGCVPAYIWIGDSYVAENRLEEAVKFWSDMIKVAPNEAYLVMGRLKKVLFELGKFGAISDICRDILSLATDNIDARLTLAEYHSKKGEHSLAIEHLKKAADNHPESFRPVLALAIIYHHTNERDKLKDLLEQMENSYESHDLEYRCQSCHYKSTEKIWLCPSCQAVNSFAK